MPAFEVNMRIKAMCGMQLAAHADLYVNDAFGCAHRAHASTEGVTHYLTPCVAGLLMQKVAHALHDSSNITDILSDKQGIQLSRCQHLTRKL